MVVLSKWRISAALTTGVPQGIIFRFSPYPEISCLRVFENAVFAPLLQVPPAGGGNPKAVPLAKQGNLTEGVFKKCRAMRLAGGT
jgi:hypothetical protein